MATTAPSGTAIASSTTERAETIDPQAAEAIDFTNFTFPDDSCGDIFHEVPTDGFTLDGGEAHGGQPADEDFYSVYLRPELSYGDLDGDGIEEALVVLDCTPGNRPYGFASVWTPDADGGATRLVQVASNVGTDPGRGDHKLQSATLTDGSIEVVWQVFSENDPACCPTEEARVTLVWRDGALVAASPAVYTEAEQPG